MWDEILDGGDLDQGTAVMIWKHKSRGVAAYTLGHYAIMAPTRNCYLDDGVRFSWR